MNLLIKETELILVAIYFCLISMPLEILLLLLIYLRKMWYSKEDAMYQCIKLDIAIMSISVALVPEKAVVRSHCFQWLMLLVR